VVPWIAFPFAAGWSNYGAPYTNCYYRLRGDMVDVRGTFRMNTPAAAAMQTIGTLPTGYRVPTNANVQFTCPQVGGAQTIIEVQYDGTLKLAAGAGSVAGFIAGFSYSITGPA